MAFFWSQLKRFRSRKKSSIWVLSGSKTIFRQKKIIFKNIFRKKIKYTGFAGILQGFCWNLRPCSRDSIPAPAKSQLLHPSTNGTPALIASKSMPIGFKTVISLCILVNFSNNSCSFLIKLSLVFSSSLPTVSCQRLKFSAWPASSWSLTWGRVVDEMEKFDEVLLF